MFHITRIIINKQHERQMGNMKPIRSSQELITHLDMLVRPPKGRKRQPGAPRKSCHVHLQSCRFHLHVKGEGNIVNKFYFHLVPFPPPFNSHFIDGNAQSRHKNSSSEVLMESTFYSHPSNGVQSPEIFLETANL